MMRLIDADVFFKNFPELAIEPYINAPTVEYPFYQEAYQTGYEEGHIDGVLQAEKLYARPQGKWARHDEWRNSEYIGGFYHINCPEIESGAAIFSKWESNFCPNCGADMRGGAK